KKIYRTFIEESFEGDAYFPEIEWSKWQLTERNQGQRDEKNPYDYYFETYQRTDS
ncbi:dihydrofolate reductase, partial [Enterococcus sp. S181_ASV_20]|nr:dihydrofolate reductase [Enterococcus sp. S181_ASV_20]